MDSISRADNEIFDDYINYLMNIQDELLSDVIKSSQSKTYNIIFYISVVFFTLGFFYYFRSLILLTRGKICKTYSEKKTLEKKFTRELNKILKQIVKYTIIISFLLLSDPITCFIVQNSLNISNYINLSIYFKFIGLLLFIIYITYTNDF